MAISDKWRVHSSARPLEKMLARSQTADPMRGGIGKPYGLWYGFGESWLEWVEEHLSDLALVRNKYLYRLEVDPTRILTVVDLPAFHEEFKGEMFPGSSRVFRDMGEPVGDLFKDGIDWAKVARKWGGIEFPVYLWRYRLDYRFRWYYGWDCASGCIWEPAALLSFKAIERPPKPTLEAPSSPQIGP